MHISLNIGAPLSVGVCCGTKVSFREKKYLFSTLWTVQLFASVFCRSSQPWKRKSSGNGGVAGSYEVDSKRATVEVRRRVQNSPERDSAFKRVNKGPSVCKEPTCEDGSREAENKTLIKSSHHPEHQQHHSEARASSPKRLRTKLKEQDSPKRTVQVVKFTPNRSGSLQAEKIPLKSSLKKV